MAELFLILSLKYIYYLIKQVLIDLKLISTDRSLQSHKTHSLKLTKLLKR